MCGIAGKIYLNGKKVNGADLKSMTDAISHRGPDGEGFYINPSGNVGLGHRRLAIIDLSPAASQPMTNEDGTIWIVYNGEIYNFQELRSDLERLGHKFKSKSDTEVIIHLYEEYGIDCLKHLRGMFAFAVWDEKNQQLFLARDRLGKKPLKYYLGKDVFIFASELKAILTQLAVKPEVDDEALPHFFAFNHLAASATGFKEIYKLPPAHYAVLKDNQLTTRKYWEIDFGKKAKFASYEEAKIELKRLLTEAVEKRLIADVPLGAMLSGGIDSSLVVGLMSRFSRPKTFSIGFAEEKLDERLFARIVADHFGADHTDLEVKPDTIEILPKLVRQYEEPYADSSALPTYYLAELTRRSVKVALNGDGGDEAFGGYRRYKYWNLFHYFKKDIYYDIATRQYFSSLNPKPYTLNPKLKRLDDIFKLAYQTFLPNDLLIKMDIATMAFGLEARSPFLDQELVEFAASLPSFWKVSGLKTKIILKDAFKDFLPEEIMKRRKYGFELPVDNWFRGPLYQWASDIFLDSSTIKRGYFDKKEIEKLLKEHKTGVKNHGQRIWLLLCFEFWLGLK